MTLRNLTRVARWLAAMIVGVGAVTGALDKILSFVAAHVGWVTPARARIGDMFSWIDGDALLVSGHPQLAKACLLAWGMLVAWLASEWHRKHRSFHIVSPRNGDEVTGEFKVRGRRCFAGQHLQLLVHDGNDNKWWVQEEPTESLDWEVTAYVGRRQDKIGKTFRLVAVAMPKPAVATFDQIPPGYTRSPIITVIKRA